MAPTDAGASPARSPAIGWSLPSMSRPATFIRAAHRRQDGYKAHIAVEPDTGIITDCALHQANGAANSEATVGLTLLFYSETAPIRPMAREFRAELAARGHCDRVKPAPLRPAVEGGFTIDDFTIDHASRQVSCPAGLTRRLTAHGAAVYGVACQNCSLRTRCTAAVKGKTLKVSPHHALQRSARVEARKPQWLNEYRQHRPMLNALSPG